jgi:hypothetical protein
VISTGRSLRRAAPPHQPGLGQILAAGVLGEFGDNEHRYATARNRKNILPDAVIDALGQVSAAVPAEQRWLAARYVPNLRALAPFRTFSPSIGVAASDRGAWCRA